MSDALETLQRVTVIAHWGGLGELSVEDALILIRKLTADCFNDHVVNLSLKENLEIIYHVKFDYDS